MKFIAFTLIALLVVLLAPSRSANAAAVETREPLWMKVRALTKFDRTKITQTGVSIEVTGDDYVMVLGDEKQAARLKAMGVLQAQFTATPDLLDFPANDSDFHNYAELTQALQQLTSTHPAITKLDSIGKSVEGRDLWRLTISEHPAQASQLPTALIMGGHHAREHVSVEVPLMFAQKFLAAYDANDADVVRLVKTRDIEIVPLVNPDGAEWDIENGSYKLWRKNRDANPDGSRGVDLNRNYATGWDNVEGASDDPGNETFHGPKPFSEPETQAVKAWIESRPNTTTLLTLHTYSELVLWPMASDYDHVSDARDESVFETMGKQMASWNGYSPMQASSLYLATGDTCDWAYTTHKIFAFTFEMDPSGFVQDGFYPGQAKLPEIFDKNYRPMLYMIEVADNPYKTIEPKQAAYGLTTPLVH